MPMYDYECDSCQTQFPVMCKIADREIPKPCPECGSTTHQVIISAPMQADGGRIGRAKPPKEFQNLLKSIHKRNPGSRMNEYADV